MTQYEMTENLSRKANVTLEEAKAALENGDWNMLTATHLLEQEKFRKMQELEAVAAGGEAMAVQIAPEPQAEAAEVAGAEAVETAQTAEAVEGATARAEKAEAPKAQKRCHGEGLKKLGLAIARLVARGNRNRFDVRKGDEKVMDVPVTALVILMLCAFWVCLPLLVIGLFAGCRYRFSGQDLGREGLNGALAKAADAADRMKKTVAEA